MTDPLSIRLGASGYHADRGDVGWDSASIDGESYLRVSNVDAMPPFFMSIVGDSDVWLFAGSNAQFVAGRVGPDGALFPYLNVDRILERPDSGGARTAMLVRQEDSWALWEPWQDSGRAYRLQRNLYKHIHGTSVVFEETNLDLGLRFRSELTSCAAYGVVRLSRLDNLGDHARDVRYLDGWHEMLPPGLSAGLVSSLSYLTSAYMRHEQTHGIPLGIYTLNARLSDRAEPSESLRAAVGWSLGHDNPTILLSSRDLDGFRRGEDPALRTEVRGERGACLVAGRAMLEAGAAKEWLHVADTNLDHARLTALRNELTRPRALDTAVREAVVSNRRQLERRIAAADGLQRTADRAVSIHHFANVLYNAMRGGTFVDGYRFPSADFADFVASRNATLASRHSTWLRELPDTLSIQKLQSLVSESGDAQLMRLAAVYLPLTFSRRHGDPSRPWNQFSINLRDEYGRLRFGYEGNWRDIFQNWEALAASYPGWLPNMINVFLNATTADGYNPYRITRDGIDWEVPEPDDPSGNIGYWGDHQIIYLLRLLEADVRYHPGRLAAELGRRAYAFAEVPYEIGGFDELAADPRHSITFNADLDHRLSALAEEIGGDGRLRRTSDGEVALVGLAEKLLVPLLAKLTNFVPGGGIWLNTQRPEWNDANNALAGWGLSMVTVYYMRRYLTFCRDLFADAGASAFDISSPLARLLGEVTDALASMGDDPYPTLESLGRAGERYRSDVYSRTVAPTETVAVDRILRLLSVATAAVDGTIAANRRADGLYHGYNTLALTDDGADVDHLAEMLEGQVAALSAGLLSPEEALRVLTAMRHSDLYREDQHSYMLYPDRELKSFLDRNIFDADEAAAIPLLKRMLDEDDRTIVVRGGDGLVHFQADLTNAADVLARLRRLGAHEADEQAILALWEKVFNHRDFTGRSTNFFAFEGLGSIYWHMVAKLLLAVQECHDGAEPAEAELLAAAYDDIRSGLGFTKTPEVFGAIPTDPYSHSPRHMGAQQPGMTGQVKEEVLTRWGELGVVARGGRLCFEPRLLHRSEFFDQPDAFEYVDVDGHGQRVDLPVGALGFTICQVPVVYRLADAPSVTVTRSVGAATTSAGNVLSPDDSRRVFHRDGTIRLVLVDVPSETIRA